MWWVQPLEIANSEGKPTGRWRLTARSDEDGGGPFGDTTHDHASAEEAQACERCDDFTAGITGFPSKRRQAQMREERERQELERLKAKYEPSADCEFGLKPPFVAEAAQSLHDLLHESSHSAEDEHGN